MNLKMNNKVAMVAAASKGLGYGIAQTLLQEGCRVSIASRNADSIKNAAKMLQETTMGDVDGFTCDVSDIDAIETWVESTVKIFGKIDYLVVNAGGPPAGTFTTFNDQDWFSAFNLTLMSAVRLIRTVYPHMVKNGSGSILVITSSTIKEPAEMLLLSNIMRSGVAALAKSLSREFAPFNIRVNNLVPGRFDTDRVRELDAIASQKEKVTPGLVRQRNCERIPFKRYGTIEEFGAAAAFLLSDISSYTTGESLVVDGGTMRSV
jgi:3-oxoacyl-[acyl-carrier protein] reductase